MSVINTQPLIGASGNQGGAYNLSKSLRFRSSASAYLNRTPASASNQTTWTWSCWVKKGTVGGYQNLFSAYSSVNSNSGVSFHTDTNAYSIDFYAYDSAYTARLLSSQLMRDYSAWYHIVAVYDSTQATASNRMKLYLNGVQMTAFSVATYPSQNVTTNINSTNAHFIGNISGSNYFDGYLAEQNFIDGQALTPSSFGSTNATTGVWQPAQYTGTYGTNGFYLPFTNTTSTTTLGYDLSGNSNNWTTNNISLTAGSTYDSMTDVPTLTSATTANYAVLNPLGNYGLGTVSTLSNGNLTATNGGNSWWISTIGIPSTGKFYCEYTPASVTNVPWIGVFSTVSAYGLYKSDGTITINGSNVATVATYAANDVVAVAYDAGTGAIAFYKNNTSVYTGTVAYASPMFFAGFVSTGNTVSVNFGQQGFAYTPPTGYVALNTYNLPDSTIVAGNKYMDATTYTGNGSTQSITNAGSFKPDLVWVKQRSGTDWHILQDSVRGVGKNINTNNTNAESGNSGDLISSFNSNGFTVNSTYLGSSNTTSNGNGSTFVGWQWQAGQGSTSSNTQGTITSTVSVNASAGFSIVTYTGTGANATVGHGLGVAPSMMIFKDRSNGTYNWAVWHTSLGGGDYALQLNTTAASSNAYDYWNGSPSSTTFGIGTDFGTNKSGDNYVAYCWSEIPGFSKAFSYTGNGSSDGSFVYLGFRPKFVLVKRSSSANTYWNMYDTTRSAFNVADDVLYANLSDAEAANEATLAFDLLSNGFKARTTGSSINQSGETYIGIAFAESPFKNSLAR